MKGNAEKKVDKYIGPFLDLLLWPFKCRGKLRKPKRILIVRLWAIGESILTLPMIKALKERFPNAKIDVLVRDKAYKQVFYKNEDIDTLVYWKFSNLTKKFHAYDLAIDTEPYLNISAISSFFMAKKSIGFSHGFRALLYNKKIRYNDMQPVPLTYMDMVTPFGIKEYPKKLVKLKYPKKAKDKAKNLLNEAGVRKKDFIVGFFAGASQNARCRIWPPKKFAELGDNLSKKYKAKVVLFGLDSEKGINDTIKNNMNSKVIDLTGKTSLPESIAAIEKCNLFISNDSGPMHIAAAQGVKTIGLFGPNLPIRFGPYGPGNIGIRRDTRKPCINVHKGQIPNCNHDHMSMIKVKDVLDAVKEVKK